MTATDYEVLKAADKLIEALDLPNHAPSAAARLNIIAKDSKELDTLLGAYLTLSAHVDGELAETAAPWRDKDLKVPHARWTAVCGTFPSLEGPRVKEAINGGKLRDLEQLGRDASMGEGVKHAIRFALSLWNPGFMWECGKFEIVPALNAWDETHAAAFRAWVADPWWP